MDLLREFGNTLRRSAGAASKRLAEGWRSLQGRTDEPSAKAFTGDQQEFDDLLAEVGSDAEVVTASVEAQLRFAHATIEELRHNLQELQPLGERLAEAEQARLALLEDLESTRLAQVTPKSEGESAAALGKALEEIAARDRRLARQAERIDRWRAKFEERNRVASERWRELVRLRRDLRELERAAKR